MRKIKDFTTSRKRDRLTLFLIWRFFMPEIFNAYAGAAFGMEGLVSAELKRLGMREVRAENGGVRFQADADNLFLCNLRLRFCDRVFILLAEAECLSFEDLFQLVSSVAWEKLMNGTEKINISAHCARSRLMSPRDCQSISKKAVIERLRRNIGKNVFPESGPDFPVQVSVHQDRVKILLNTSGASLSRRGYRTWNGEAPLRETLASALVELSPWRPGMPLHDPCCGTGTLLIEAAFRAAHRAPGLARSFAMETFAFVDPAVMNAVRKDNEDQTDLSLVRNISGSDIDPEALRLAGLHVSQAGLEGLIPLSRIPLQELNLQGRPGVLICNPPYGERLSDQRACRELYHDMAILWRRHPGWRLCAISSDPGFEQAFGRRAEKKRRLYNGRLECVFYIY